MKTGNKQGMLGSLVVEYQAGLHAREYQERTEQSK